jgi:hypothetical protein
MQTPTSQGVIEMKRFKEWRAYQAAGKVVVRGTVEDECGNQMPETLKLQQIQFVRVRDITPRLFRSAKVTYRHVLTGWDADGNMYVLD